MALILTGLSHQCAELELLELLAAAPAASVLGKLKSAGWERVTVLSTCNRFEIYAEVEPEAAAGRLDELEAFAGKLAGVDLKGKLYRKRDAQAVEHLFAVASGLDSMVIGEGEILGQVKQAYEAALGMRLTGKVMNVLWQRALYVGKLVRSQTAIAAGHTSAAGVAVELAEKIFGDLSQCRVLIIGAGSMAETAAKYFLSEKVAQLYVANRTFDKAVLLAARFKAQAVRWDSLTEMLAHVDVVLSSTGADTAVLKREQVEIAMSRRQGRSLFIIDIAMPRDVEESVHGLEHVYLYTLEDLKEIVDGQLQQRRREQMKAERLVKARAEEFFKWLDAARDGVRADLKHGLDGAGRRLAE
ncbi:MAG: glutamyl-tRNA reductase [Elusimicrobia bacterium RIFCSPLOWO2_12_FULL_59_9]|nr:MAG: glutamyl-tRNA reductase [Elusimicrobia bacterium RIFCSPLOWO2_12_FULL_59_9]